MTKEQIRAAAKAEIVRIRSEARREIVRIKTETDDEIARIEAAVANEIAAHTATPGADPELADLVDVQDGCWIPTHHGRVRYQGRYYPTVAAWAWEVSAGYGPIDRRSAKLYHVCGNPACVRPDHLLIRPSATEHAAFTTKWHVVENEGCHCVAARTPEEAKAAKEELRALWNLTPDWRPCDENYLCVNLEHWARGERP
jgi:hypothetical protein